MLMFQEEIKHLKKFNMCIVIKEKKKTFNQKLVNKMSYSVTISLILHVYSDLVRNIRICPTPSPSLGRKIRNRSLLSYFNYTTTKKLAFCC